MLDKLNKSTKMAAAIYVCIFILLLVCNVLSLYIVDDYRYLFSFTDFERIESLPQILTSMRGHRYSMNGRLIAHSLVQFFGMLPMWLFDVVNSLVFVLQTALICKIARGTASRSNLLLIAVFCATWLFEPVFGQVNLWQDGACNYLWSIVLSFLFLWPFMNEFLYDKPIKTTAGKVCFLLLSFAAGGYSETVSAAAIFMAMLFVGLQMLCGKKKCKPIWALSLVFAFLGYISIYTAPAQWREKSAEMSVAALLRNFANVAGMYWSLFSVCLCAFLILLVLNLADKTEKKRVLLALVFFAGSLAANFIMTFASYYTSRSAVGAFAFLLTADAILLQPLLQKNRYKVLLTGALAILMLATVPALVTGVQDIGATYQYMRENETYIYECRENGILDIEVPLFPVSTKYSEAYDAKYLDTEDPMTWPNDSMAKYYEVNSLIGVYPE